MTDDVGCFFCYADGNLLVLPCSGAPIVGAFFCPGSLRARHEAFRGAGGPPRLRVHRLEQVYVDGPFGLLYRRAASRFYSPYFRKN